MLFRSEIPILRLITGATGSLKRACRTEFEGATFARQYFADAVRRLREQARTVNGRRPPLQGGGCGFESHRAYQIDAHLAARISLEKFSRSRSSVV